MRVKINVNLGISGDCKDYEMELRKVRMAIDMGAESIMDLSNYGKTNTFRKQLIDMSPAMIGTVPMYDAIGYLEKDLLEITAKDFLRVVEAHAQEFLCSHSCPGSCGFLLPSGLPPPLRRLSHDCSLPSSDV